MKKLVLISLFLGTTSLFAQGVATVLSTSQKVVANHNGSEHAISRGSSLEPGDAIITAANSAATIKYQNGTLVNISSDTHYKILAYSPKSSEIQIKAELKTGSIHSKTTGTTKETLKTPVMTLAILGTVYTAGYNKAGLNLSVGEGAVQMGHRGVVGNGVIVRGGESVFIKASGQVGPVTTTSSAASSTTSSSSSVSSSAGLTSATTVSSTTTSTVAATTVVTTPTAPILTVACP